MTENATQETTTNTKNVKVRTSITIDPALFETIKVEAAATDSSVSKIIEDALKARSK